MIKESEVFKYYRTLNKITPKKTILVEQMGKENIFISVTDNTFYIYDIDKFNVLFMGPHIEKIDSFVFNKDILYICSSLMILLFRRGILIKKLDVSRFVQNKSQYIKKIECFGNVICILFSEGVFIVLGYKSERECNVSDVENNDRKSILEHTDAGEIENEIQDQNICELESLYRTDNVTSFYHPLTYVNKILLIKEACSLVLYNFMKEKLIYSYVNSKDEIYIIEQTKTIDIVGIGYEDRISLFDIKKDKILFTFKIKLEKDVELSFSDNKMIVCTGNVMHVYDLENKKRIVQKENIRTSKFLDDRYLIASTSSAISIYEIVNHKLDLIKNKIVSNKKIRGFEFFTKNNLLVVEDHNIYSYNIFKDNLNFKFKYLDGIRQYPNPCTKINTFDINKNIVTVENNQLYYFDHENKNSNYVFNADISLVAVYKDFCCIYSDNLYLINLKSKIVHKKIKTEGMFKENPNIIRMSNETVYLSSGTDIIMIQLNTCKKISIDGDNFIEDFKVFEDILVVRTKKEVKLYNNRNKEFRYFKIENTVDFTLSRDSKWIGILEENMVHIYDVISNVCIDRIPSSKKLKYGRFTNNLEFLCLAMEDNDIILLSNKSFFNPIEVESNKEDYKEFNRKNQLEIIKYNKIENKLYNEILLIKEYERRAEENDELVEDTMKKLNLTDSRKEGDLSHKVIDMLLDNDFVNSLTEEETVKILHLLLPHLKEYFNIVQRILNKILKKKISILKSEDIEDFYSKFKSIYDDYENDYVRPMDDAGFLHSSPKKEYTGNKTLRSLTIKQLQATEHEEGSTVFYVDGVELSTVQVIGWVMKVNSTQTGKIFTIEDGTGFIDCSVWPSKSYEEEIVKLIEELVLVKVTGTLKTYANNRSITCVNVSIVDDYNEILYHFTNSIKQHLFFTKQLNPKETSKKLDLNKIQKDIIDCLKNNQDDSGLSSGIICKMLGSSYTEKNIQENLDLLVESCYLVIDENSEYKVV